MKKAILFFIFFLSYLPICADQPITMRSGETPIDKLAYTKSQYIQAFENVAETTQAFADCLENQACSAQELQNLSKSIKTNLGTMAANLTTLTIQGTQSKVLPQ